MNTEDRNEKGNRNERGHGHGHGLNAVVIGGGVAGAASAIALRRIGADVTVYEAYQDPAGTVGSFVSLTTNGLRALDTLGVLPAVQQAGFPVERQRMWSGRGKLLGDVPRSRRPEETLRSVTLLRGDLVATLRAQAIAAGARILTGERMTPDAIRTHAEHADVLIGADGIWSTTRGVVDPAAPAPHYGGIYHVSGIAEGLTPDSDSQTAAFNMTFGRHGAFIHLPAPDGTIWWSAQVSAPNPPADVHAVTLADLTGLYRTEPQPLTILRAATTIRSATLDHVLPPVTHRHRDGRIVLLGDAAHPAGAGQGASMAIEDAVVLARRLHTEPTIEAALTAYDQERQPRAGKLAKAATANRDAKTAGPIAAHMRDLITPLFFTRMYPKATDWLYTYDAGTLTT
ncbi:MAG TPA: FAD-dependent oxidoreductase [Actinocrinis sp.]|nr:FAD-dependent oxidoreductase [Actinocrinis sp.]